MDKFQIETAQNVQIARNVATLGDRILAYLLDVLVIITYEVLMFFILFAVFNSNNSMLDSDMSFWAILAVLGLPPFLYYLLMESLNNGQTLGKMARQIRVVRLNGDAARFQDYLIRWIFRIIDFNLTSGGCALLVFLLNGKGQRLGDIAAKTTVISEKNPISLEDTLRVDIPEDYVPEYPQVTVFSDREIQTVKNIFNKAIRNGNTHVIDSLAEKATKVMDIPRDDKSSVDFIERIIADYNYYTQQ